MRDSSLCQNVQVSQSFLMDFLAALRIDVVRMTGQSSARSRSSVARRRILSVPGISPLQLRTERWCGMLRDNPLYGALGQFTKRREEEKECLSTPYSYVYRTVGGASAFTVRRMLIRASVGDDGIERLAGSQ
jgi:hypothetical protein